MMTLVTLVLTGLVAHASPDIDASYESCVKASRSDDESARCLDRALVEMDGALAEVVNQLLEILNSEAEQQPKAKLLQDAHAKWLPSRDADCQLQGSVTMDTAEEAADAAKLCVYQANVPRLKQYQRFVGFLRK